MTTALTFAVAWGLVAFAAVATVGILYVVRPEPRTPPATWRRLSRGCRWLDLGLWAAPTLLVLGSEDLLWAMKVSLGVLLPVALTFAVLGGGFATLARVAESKGAAHPAAEVPRP
jgi:hypothetical protein